MQYKAGSSRTPQPTDAQEDDSDNTVTIGGATGPTVLTCILPHISLCPSSCESVF